MTTIIYLRNRESSEHIILSDTRSSKGCNIHSNNSSKVRVFEKFMVGIAGDPSAIQIFQLVSKKLRDSEGFFNHTLPNAGGCLVDEDGEEYTIPIEACITEEVDISLLFQEAIEELPECSFSKDSEFEAILCIRNSDLVYEVLYGAESGLQIIRCDEENTAIGSGGTAALTLLRYGARDFKKIFKTINKIDLYTSGEYYAFTCRSEKPWTTTELENKLS